MASSLPSLRAVQPAWLRVLHWVNAAAVLIMMTSGWQIYDASPLFGSIHFPEQITLGGWLAGALLWHFAAMWLLVASFVVYLACNLLSGRFGRKLLPVDLRGVLQDAWDALRGALSHEDLTRYNQVQKLAYLAILADIVLLVLSGLAIWKPVQLSLLRELLGGYDSARVVHFCAMVFAAAFIVLHVVMSLLVPRSLRAMIL